MLRFLSPVRRLTLGALVMGLMLFATAQAQTFPSKPLRVVVPFGPGGSSDVVARIVIDGAAEALGQPLVIENVPGAGGNIGTARVAKAAPDGYTLVECTIGTCAINPGIYASTGYDLQKDFVPVFLVGGVRNIFTVHPSTSIKSIADLVAYARANPGRLPAAIGAVGSSNHLTPTRPRCESACTSNRTPISPHLQPTAEHIPWEWPILLKGKFHKLGVNL